MTRARDGHTDKRNTDKAKTNRVSIQCRVRDASHKYKMCPSMCTVNSVRHCL